MAERNTATSTGDSSQGHRAAILGPAMQRIRQWEVKHLPIGDSLISFDLLLEVYSVPLDQGLYVKDLMWRMRRPERTLRLIIRRLEERGWIQSRPHEADARARSVKLTALGRQWMDDYLAVVINELKTACEAVLRGERRGV